VLPSENEIFIKLYMEDTEMHIGRVKYVERSNPIVQDRIYASVLGSVKKTTMTSHTGKPTRLMDS
jgi:hypothetical protein